MPVWDNEQPDRRHGSESSGLSQETVRNNENSHGALNTSSNGRNDDAFPFPGSLMDR
jgi:hypothetical protein